MEPATPLLAGSPPLLTGSPPLPSGSPLDAVRRHAHATDPPADALAAAFAALPAGQGRQMLETALARGAAEVAGAPAALHEFFAHVDRTPLWVDWERVERGGTLFLRSGLLGVSVLSLACLPMMYRLPAGNKPLVFTGQLLRRAPRRLAETARFTLETSTPGGLRRHAAGFATTLRVRLMHAQVRRLLRRHERWNADWGVPVSQLHMAATNVTLSVVFLDGLRRLGVHVGRDESDALMSLWRYSGHLMGVVPELQCSTEEEGRHLLRCINAFEGAPDADSRALIDAVMTASYLPELDRHAWRVPLSWDLSRQFVGDTIADGLGYPPPRRWRWLLPVARPLLAGLNGWQRTVPGAGALAARRGAAQVESIIGRMFAGSQQAAAAHTPTAPAPAPAPAPANANARSHP
jgi:hypothetical protein